MRTPEQVTPPTVSKEQAYSGEFNTLVSDEARLIELLRGSHVEIDGPEKMKDWEKGRRYITQAIDRDGTIVDFGCANGFLLKCLKEWSTHNLDVYGYDIDQDAVEKARALFPGQENHFATPNDRPQEWPTKFDMVYWNVWDNYNFNDKEQTKLVDTLLAQLQDSGRLIMGFYSHDENEGIINQAKIDKLRELGYNVSEAIRNGQDHQLLAYIDKKEHVEQD